MKYMYTPLLFAAFFAADAAIAQTAAPKAPTKIEAGAAVSDPKGGAVGTVKEVVGNFAVLKTDQVEVRLPLTSFAIGPKGPVVGMTREQVNQAAAAAASTVDKLLVKGAPVYGLHGTQLGTVNEVTADNVVVATRSGKASLSRNAFTQGQKGLAIGMTAAQFQAQVAGASADLSALLAKGTQIFDPQGTLVGTIGEVDGDKAIVTTTSGKKVALPVNALGKGSTGLVIGISAAEIEKTAAQSEG